MPKDAFLESFEAAADPQSTRGSRVTLPLDSDGKIVWDKLSDKKRGAFVSALKSDPEGLAQLGLKESEGGALDWKLKAQHVGELLDRFSEANKFLIPLYVFATTKDKKTGKGGIIIPPDVAAEVFSFTADHHKSLDQKGADAANHYLPEAWRKWILTTSPGAALVEFTLTLYMILRAQYAAAMAATLLLSHQPTPQPMTVTPPPPANGEARPEAQL